MRQSIRALGWTVIILTLLLFAYLGTAIYSIFQTISQGFMIGEMKAEMENGTLLMSMPISINNTGLYDINEFEITTTLTDEAGRLIVTNTTRLENIRRGDVVTKEHMLVMNIIEIFVKNRNLIFNDTEIQMLISVGLKYAYALKFTISMSNIFSMPWGAPMHGLVLRELNVQGSNGTHIFMELIMDFENHFFVEVGGPLRLIVYNEGGEEVGEGIGFLHVAPGGRPEKPIQIIVSLTRPEAYTGSGYADIYLILPLDEQQIELGRIRYE